MTYEPLAAKMRPETLNDIFGQDHILGQNMLLRRMIEADTLSSIILYGPPGIGKTTCYCKHDKMQFQIHQCNNSWKS